MKLLKLCAISILLTLALASADCPYSGMGILTYDSIVVSKWEDIDETACCGVCPSSRIEQENAWAETNDSATWVFEMGQWKKKTFRCKEIYRMNTPVIDCRWYEEILIYFEPAIAEETRIQEDEQARKSLKTLMMSVIRLLIS